MVKSLAIVIAVLLTGCAGGPGIFPHGAPTQEQLSMERFYDCPSDYKERIMSRMQQLLIDPESARFKFPEPIKYVFIKRDERGQEKPLFGYLVPVVVNAKNRLGGYAGDKVTFCHCHEDIVLSCDDKFF